MIKSSTRKCVADHHATVPLSRATTSNTSYLTMRQERWSLVDTHMSLVEWVIGIYDISASTGDLSGIGLKYNSGSYFDLSHSH